MRRFLTCSFLIFTLSGILLACDTNSDISVIWFINRSPAAEAILPLPARSRHSCASRARRSDLDRGDFLRDCRHRHLLGFWHLLARMPAGRSGGHKTARAEDPPTVFGEDYDWSCGAAQGMPDFVQEDGYPLGTRRDLAGVGADADIAVGRPRVSAGQPESRRNAGTGKEVRYTGDVYTVEAVAGRQIDGIEEAGLAGGQARNSMNRFAHWC